MSAIDLALVKLVEDPNLYRVDIDYLPQRDDPEIEEAVLRLKEMNYQNGPFVTSEAADARFEQVRSQLLAGPVLQVGTQALATPAKEDGSEEGVFDA